MRSRRSAWIYALLFLLASAASAHEIGTTRVDARIDAQTYTIDWFTTASRRAAAAEIRFDDMRVQPRITVLPDRVRYEGEIPEGAKTFAWRHERIFVTYALTVNGATQWIEGDAESRPVRLATKSAPEVARQYVLLGFTHILPYGLDHILFVLGIFLLTTKLRPVVAQVTTFTVAHSITLALTMYGVVSLSPRIVEPLIALSIVYVAVENVFAREVSRWRIAIIFAFGLLHGMGFAGVLRDLGLPRNQFATALVTFNAGVEVAQLTIIAIGTLLVAYWHRDKSWYRGRVVVPASLAIAVTGLVWTIQRVL